MKKRTKMLLLLFMICNIILLPLKSFAQTPNWGNTFITGGGETLLFGTFKFRAYTGGPMEGIIGTERTIPIGKLGFAIGAQWNNASNTAHIDGYANTYQPDFFIFPIGDNGLYRPAAVSKAAEDNPTNAAYYNADPTFAITTKLRDQTKNEIPLPDNDNPPFPTSYMVKNLKKVSPIEYWDINGSVAAKITLTWDAISNINSLTRGKLYTLTIAGWDGTQWVNIPSKVDVTSILGSTSTLTSGSITTTSEIIPSAYKVYTLAVAQDRVLVSAKVYLQGAWNGSVLTTNLNSQGVIPLIQPYKNTPFSYKGTEAVTVFPSNITDWVLVELYNNSTPATLIATRAALLQNDGMIVDLDGTSSVVFEGFPDDNYKIGIRHRNHLPVLTATTHPLTYDESRTQLYDFTVSQAKAYQNSTITNNVAMVNLNNSGKFGLWGGDGNSNGRVSYIGVANDEYFLMATAMNGLLNTPTQRVYSNGDYNMDGTLSYTDQNSDESFLLTTVLGGSGTQYLLRHY